VLRFLRRSYAVFKAYFTSDFIRSHGFIYGLLSMGLWIIMFTIPVTLFTPGGVSRDEVASRIYVGIMLFYYFSAASWDWAAELRWMIMNGRLEYYITSGAGFAPHYFGILPFTLMWLCIALVFNYVLISIVWAPPAITIINYYAFAVGFILYTVSLIGYALLLGSSMLSTGSTGYFVEFLSFILPVATGGLFPLKQSPEILKTIALLTPFSYPAELLRYSLLGIEPVVSIEKTILIGGIYGALFLILGVIVFRIQLRKALRNGFPTVSLW